MATKKIKLQENVAYCYVSSISKISIDVQKSYIYQYCEIMQYTIKHFVEDISEDQNELYIFLDKLAKDKPEYLIVYDDSVIPENLVVPSKILVLSHETTCEEIALADIEEVLKYRFSKKRSDVILNKLDELGGNALHTGRKAFGYISKKNEKYKIDPVLGPVVLQIFEDYANGKSMVNIARELNEKGYMTTKNMPFTVKSLWHILTDKKYTGEYKWGDVIIPDGYPQIVTPELYEKVQTLMQQNKHGKRGAGNKQVKVKVPVEKDWLLGYIVCGDKLCRLIDASYVCDDLNISKDLLNDIVLYYINKELEKPELRIMLADRVSCLYNKKREDDALTKQRIKEQIHDVDIKLSNLTNAIESGAMSEVIVSRIQNLTAQKNMLNSQYRTEFQMQRVDLTPQKFLKYFDSFVGNLSNMDMRKKILKYLVKSVDADKDFCVVHFYYTDDIKVVYSEFIKNKELDDTLMQLVNDHSITTNYLDYFEDVF